MSDQIFEEPRVAKEAGGTVASVDPGSPAARAGIEPGDRVRSLEGRPLRDILDYRFRLGPGRQSLEVERDGRLLKLEIENDDGAEPGIGFSRSLFDGMAECRCNCLFCFVDQLPSGLREPLYLKDDDYRLSFLYGNFITLNNLVADDLDRIIEQRLSPLYVSVHAADPGLRARLMGCSLERARRGLDNLLRLGEAGIETHIQVVLCPGINDGVALEQTIGELARDFAAIGSVGIVPVAVEEWFRPRRGRGRGQSLRPVDAAGCEAVAATVARWQEGFRRERGHGFVYAADEFYLRSGRTLPGVREYDGLPQYENGIGIAAVFLDEAEAMMEPLLDDIQGKLFLLTGTLGQPVVGQVAAADDRVSPLVVRNHLFGTHVTVTGLLGGRDIIRTALEAGLGGGDTLLLPACVLDSAGERFLDDITLEELSGVLECGVRVLR